MVTEWMLEVDGVRKRYRDVVANDGITMEVRPGEVCGLLGPNGAGKTTLVRQIVGLARPDSGRIFVGGVDVSARPADVRTLCALQPQAALAITGLTARQAIMLAAELRGVGRAAAARHTHDLLEELELGAWADRRVSAASGGVARLVMFCMAVVARPKLLILDEPTNDVDPLRRRRLWELVRRSADEGAAVLLVTHNVLEAEQSVDNVVILNRGSVLVSGAPASLRKPGAPLKLEFVARTTDKLGDIPLDAFTLTSRGFRHILELRADDVPAVVEWARTRVAAGTIEDFSLGPQTLEDAYVALVDPTQEQPHVAA